MIASFPLSGELRLRNPELNHAVKQISEMHYWAADPANQ
jgi:hypothetical protein